MILQAKKKPVMPFLRAGALEVCLAQTQQEIEAAQRLRYRIFYEEMGAQHLDSIPSLRERRDSDAFDAFCDHLIVKDHERNQEVIGTYRLIRREVARRQGGFYSASEYNINILEQQPSEILEVGRSCVDIGYRTRPTMNLLWRGIVSYMSLFDVSYLFGCASFPGRNPQVYAQALSYLYHYHLAPKDRCPTALSTRYVNMNMIAKEKIDLKLARHQLPPLIKGYLRAGCCVGDGAVVDFVFNTTDICIVLKTALLTTRYSNHYNRPLASQSRKNVF